MSAKKRLDLLVYERGFAESREKAKALIMSGVIFVDNQKSDSKLIRIALKKQRI